MLIAEVAAGRRVAAVNEIFQRVAGKRPIYRAAFGFNRITHRGHRASSPSRCETGRKKIIAKYCEKSAPIFRSQRQSAHRSDPGRCAFQNTDRLEEKAASVTQLLG
jgi:hypothetical protein